MMSLTNDNSGNDSGGNSGGDGGGGDNGGGNGGDTGGGDSNGDDGNNGGGGDSGNDGGNDGGQSASEMNDFDTSNNELTAREMFAMLEHHNELRRRVGAADMQILVSKQLM